MYVQELIPSKHDERTLIRQSSLITLNLNVLYYKTLILRLEKQYSFELDK